jgi:NUDIX domain
MRLTDGAEVSREVERHGDAAAVLPYDVERRSALVVRLFRAPVLEASGEEMSEEACAGMIDNEDADTTARREAYEELGVDLPSLEFVAACGRAQGSQPNGSRSSSHLIAPMIASATEEAWKASMRESPLSSGCSRSSRPMSIKDGSPTESC